jgi:hypothetical protein
MSINKVVFNKLQPFARKKYRECFWLLWGVETLNSVFPDQKDGHEISEQECNDHINMMTDKRREIMSSIEREDRVYFQSIYNALSHGFHPDFHFFDISNPRVAVKSFVSFVIAYACNPNNIVPSFDPMFDDLCKELMLVSESAPSQNKTMHNPVKRCDAIESICMHIKMYRRCLISKLCEYGYRETLCYSS